MNARRAIGVRLLSLDRRARPFEEIRRDGDARKLQLGRCRGLHVVAEAHRPSSIEGVGVEARQKHLGAA